MGQYVWSQQLETEKGVEFSVDVFKESNTEYRPILTAQEENSYGQGFSKRRSFKSETEAKEYFQDFESVMKEEALEDLTQTATTKFFV